MASYLGGLQYVEEQHSCYNSNWSYNLNLAFYLDSGKKELKSFSELAVPNVTARHSLLLLLSSEQGKQIMTQIMG